MPFITVAANVDLHYTDLGTGAPVVLVHGWPLSGRMWEKQLPALTEAGHRVITYDRRGFGQSSQPLDGYDFDTFAADLDALLTHLDLRRRHARRASRWAAARSPATSPRTAPLASQAAVFAGAVPPYIRKTAENPDGHIDDATVEAFRAGVRTDRLAFLDGLFGPYFDVGERTDLVSDPMRAYHVHTRRAGLAAGDAGLRSARSPTRTSGRTCRR